MAEIESNVGDDETFPGNVLLALAVGIEQEVPEIEAIVFRPLTPDDPNCSISIIDGDWEGDDWVIGGGDVPDRAHYTYQIGLMVKGLERGHARTQCGLLSKKLRTMLYRSDVLSVLLAALVDTSAGITERFQRMKVTRQSRESGTVDGAHIAMSTTTVIIETENVRT